MPTDLPESAWGFLTVLGVFAALALAGLAMRKGAHEAARFPLAAAVLTRGRAMATPPAVTSPRLEAPISSRE